MTRKGYENTFRPKREDEKVPQTRQMMKRPRKGGREFVGRAIALRQSRSIIERGTEFHRDQVLSYPVLSGRSLIMAYF